MKFFTESDYLTIHELLVYLLSQERPIPGIWKVAAVRLLVDVQRATSNAMMDRYGSQVSALRMHIPDHDYEAAMAEYHAAMDSNTDDDIMLGEQILRVAIKLIPHISLRRKFFLVLLDLLLTILCTLPGPLRKEEQTLLDRSMSLDDWNLSQALGPLLCTSIEEFTDNETSAFVLPLIEKVEALYQRYQDESLRTISAYLRQHCNGSLATIIKQWRQESAILQGDVSVVFCSPP